jgi:DNA-directed RNA polymerase sigma subunit (sigma70/sigma32)
MKALRESGETLDQVGAAFGIGGARVRQLLMKLEKYNRRQATAYDVPKEQTKPQPVQLP